jgi:protocatechuate 3,4-dioxygenase beta subunit
MRKPFSSQEPRGPWPWRLRWALIVVAIGILVAVFFIVRRAQEAPDIKEPGLALTAKQKSGYQNRGFWYPSPDKAPAAAESPRIKGTVYDMRGRPVSGARVSASTFQVAGNQSTTAGSADSDAAGKFELKLPDGAFYLRAEKDGFSPSIVTARSGDDIGIVLHDGAVIEGHVKDEKGQPISHFSIDVVSPAPDDLAAPAPFLSKRFESPDGSFKIDQLPDQPVYLRATASDYSPAVTDMIKAAPGKAATAEITLQAGCQIKGIVEDASGVPVSNVFIDAELRRTIGSIGEGSVDAARQAESDQEGKFVLDHVPVGGVAIRAYDGQHAVTSMETKIESCDAPPLKIKMIPGVTLSGAVRGTDGQGVPGVKLTLQHRSIGFVNTLTDKDGNYRFEKLPPGGMRMEAQRGDQRAMLMVAIPEGQDVQRDILFPTNGNGEIKGRVTTSGTPLPGMQVMVVANSGGGMMDTRYPRTDADGSFRVTGLADGMYVLLVPSTSKVSTAQVKDGSKESVDIDISAPPPEPPKVTEPIQRPQKAGEAPAQGGGDAPGAQDSSPQQQQ